MVRLTFKFVCVVLLWLWAVVPISATASPLERHECYSPDMMRRIEGCARLLQMPNLPPQVRSEAYGLRALALSLIGRYNEALSDYDRSLQIIPNQPAVLNNRAWALFRMGRIDEALPDVEKSLRLNGLSEHAYDTRAHVLQAKGDAERAYRDYRKAVAIGGTEMVKLYQCGLQANGLYRGAITGIFTTALDTALRACVKRPDCDPLPPDEECKAALS